MRHSLHSIPPNLIEKVSMHDFFVVIQIFCCHSRLVSVESIIRRLREFLYRLRSTPLRMGSCCWWRLGPQSLLLKSTWQDSPPSHWVVQLAQDHQRQHDRLGEPLPTQIVFSQVSHVNTVSTLWEHQPVLVSLVILHLMRFHERLHICCHRTPLLINMAGTSFLLPPTGPAVRGLLPRSHLDSYPLPLNVRQCYLSPHVLWPCIWWYMRLRILLDLAPPCKIRRAPSLEFLISGHA